MKYSNEYGQAITSMARAIAAFALAISATAAHAQSANPSSHSWLAPAKSALLKNPVEPEVDSITQGRDLYSQTCMICHGPTGKGDGPAAAALQPHPGVLSDPKMWQHRDGELFWKISNGKGPMPPFKDALTEKQLWNLVNFIRTLSPRPANLPVEDTPPLASEIVPNESVSATAAAESVDGYVTRAEYDQLQRQLLALQAQLKSLAAASGQTLPDVAVEDIVLPSIPSETTASQLEALQAEVDELKQVADGGKDGRSDLLLTGYAFSGYTDIKGQAGTFNTGFNPIFLWSPTERLLFESELEIGFADGETELDLEYADLSYELNDYITVGAGKFITPFGIFRERLHPAWINRLPDAPHAFGHDGLIPPGVLGVQVRGAVPVDSTTAHYSLYAGNGPMLNVGDDEPDEIGNQHFNNYSDFSRNKTFGGRIGWLPFPELEFGYSGQFSKLNATGTSASRADATAHGPYLSYVRDSEWLRGQLDLKAEWVWSGVDPLTYDPNGDLGFGPATFSNERNGGYAQLAYRPTHAEIQIARDLEYEFRYDRLDRPSGALENADVSRYTLGLDYWLSPTAVFKVGYEFGTSRETGAESENINGLLIQAAMGF